MSGYKLSIVAASCAALVPIGMQWQTNRAHAQKQLVPPSLLQPDSGIASSESSQLPILSVVGTSRSRSSEELFAEMQQIAGLTTPYKINAGIDELMMGLEQDEMKAAFIAVQLFNDSSSSRQAHNATRRLFVRWAQFDPQQAIVAVGEIDIPMLAKSAMHGIVKGWLEHDPAAVDTFLESLPQGAGKEALRSTRWRTHAERQPVEAAEMALKIEDPDTQTKVLDIVINGFSGQDPIAGIRWLDQLDEDSVRKDNWYGRLLDELAEHQPEEAFSQTLNRLEGSLQKSTLRRVIEKWAEHDPSQAFDGLFNLDPNVTDEHIILAFGRGMTDLSLVDQVLARLEEGNEQSAFVAGLAGSLASSRSDLGNLTPSSIEQIRPMVEALPAGESRFTARWNLATAWAAIDSQSAIDWLASQPGVKDSMIEKISKRYAP